MPTVTQSEQNDYEARRLATIAQNKALLQSLQLDSAALNLSAAKPKPKPAASASKKKKPNPIRKELLDNAPRRTSSRLAGFQADSEVAKRKADDEAFAFQQAAKAKRQRVSGDLDLSDILVAGKMWDRSENFIVDAVPKAEKYGRTFTEDDIKQTADESLRAMRERMSGLSLRGEFTPNQIKITPERVYSIGFHPRQDKALVFAGDKLGNLGIFDASDSGYVKVERVKKESNMIKFEGDADDDEEDEAVPAITTFHLHSRTISCFLFPPSTPDTLLSASYDSSIRSLDLGASKAVEVYAPEDQDVDEPISGIEVPSDSPSTIYFSTLNGTFGRHDMRAPPSNAGGTVLTLLSEKKIGGFSLHPGQPHLMATASLDRKLKIWDLRQMSDRKGPSLLGEHESRLSVSHASWNSVGQVATASYDDTVKIHDFSGAASWTAKTDLSDAQMKPSTVIRHNNQTGRWVTILRAQWQQKPQDGIQKFCIGNMNRYVDVYSAKGEQLAQLGDTDLITAVPAVAQFHPTQDWIAGGTASGKLCLWT